MAEKNRIGPVLFYAIFVVFVVALGAEAFLRLTGKYQVFSELNGQAFYSEYGMVKKGWFHTRQPNDSFMPVSPDFHYAYVTNRYGFRDKNYDTTKKASTLRILVSGDSFAEGEGTPYDSTWPRILEKFLNERGFTCEVIDAGVAGSDIFYDYLHYKVLLKELKPDLIIASVNSSDYNDYLTRGGMERFYPDTTTHLKAAPWYMPLYKYSRFVRALCHKIGGFNNTGLFVSYKDYDRTTDSTNVLFASVFKKYQDEAAKNDAAFIAVIHNIPIEIKEPGIPVCQTNIRSLNNLSKLLAAEGVRNFNLAEPLKKQFMPISMEQLSYPHDMHYRPMAYAYMGKVISDSLMANELVKKP